MDPLTLSLIGAAIGGLTAKKPLQGALLGGVGGYFLPGLLSSGGAAAAATELLPTEALLLPGSPAMPAMAAPATSSLAQFSDKLKAVNSTIQPFMQAGQAVKAASSFFPESQPITTPPPQFGGGANAVFANMSQQFAQLEEQRMREEMEKRQAHRSLLSMIGGGNARVA